MANRAAFTSYTDGVDYLRANGKIKEGKFKLEKTQYREFMELAGAPKPVQEAYSKAEELLNHSVYALGTDLLREEINRKKKEGASKEELGETKVELTILGDSTNIRAHCYAKKDNRVPQTNEITTKYGTCRFTRESRRLGVTADDIAAIDKEFKELLSSK